MKRGRNFTFTKNILLGFSIAAIIVLVVFEFFIFPYKIEGNSMYPNYKNNDKIIILRNLLYRHPHRFDIVILNYPKPDSNKRIIKRIIGLSGEIFEIKEGDIYINGRKLQQPFLRRSDDVIFRSVNVKALKIPENCFYIMGDNRNQSVDSRDFGTVNSDQIKGKVLFKYWPIHNSGD